MYMYNCYYNWRSESETTEEQPPEHLSAVSSDTQPTPTQDPGTGDLLGDLLSLDLPSYNAAPPTTGGKWVWSLIIINHS